MRILYIPFVIVLLASAASAQPDTLWSSKVKEGKWTEVLSVLPLDDGYIMAGSSGDISDLFNDVIVTRMDNNGNTVWEKLFLQESYVYSAGGRILPSGVNDFVVFATICPLEEPTCDYDIGYFNIDGNGNLLEHELLMVPDFQWIEDAISTSDGGYLIAGENGDFPPYDIFVMKVDSDFNLQWHETYGGGMDEWSYCLVETTDGGYLIAGSTDSYGGADGDCFLVKVDSMGSLQYQHTFGSSVSDRISDIIEISEGEYIGLWVQFPGGSSRQTTLFSFTPPDGVTELLTFSGMMKSILLQPDGTIACTGFKYPSFMLKCMTVSGFPLWELFMNAGSLNHVGNTLCLNNDGGLLVVAKQNTGTAEIEGWILNFGAYTGVETESGTTGNLVISSVAPNPFTAGTTLVFNQPSQGPAELLVYDIAGKVVDRISRYGLEAGMNAIQWIPEKALPSGTYVAVISACGETASERFILIR